MQTNLQTNLHVIQNDSWQVGILPQTGGAVAFGRIAHNGGWLDLLRPTPEESYGTASACASCPLIPWSNRLRDARFRFRGHDYQLLVSHPDGTAIHGAARNFPWKIEAEDATSLTISYTSTDFGGVNFPFHFSTRQTFRLDGERFTLSTSVKNEDTVAFPAGFGHHPYFMRTLSSPKDNVQLEIPCSQYFEVENCLPSAGPVPIESRVDFRKARSLGDVLIDDCLTARVDEQPIHITYPESGVRITMPFDPIYQNVVLFVPLNKPFFAVEPVTNANDGFNLYEKGIPGSAVFVLEPGTERRGDFSLIHEK